MPATEIKADRKYTKDHEWAQLEDGVLTVGITKFAVDQLGDITLVDIDAGEGDPIEAGKAFGTIESVKTLSDLFAPVSGEIVAVNGELEDTPELVNEDCWGSGWMLKIKCANVADVEALLDEAQYQHHVEESDH